MSLEIVPVWQQVTPGLEAELVRFWTGNGAIADPAQATARARQVACIARGDDGAIIGVSTAHPRIVPRLRQPMYYYRNFIAEPFRGRQLAVPFLLRTKQVLQDHDLALPRPACLGIIIELENESLAAHRDDAHWADTGFTFIGYSPKGLHLRVWYFEGARLFPPAPLKKPAKAGRN